MKPQLCFFALTLAVLCGCRTVDSITDIPKSSQAVQASDAPVLSVDVLDPSIPMGESFPVAIKIQNALPSQKVNLEIIGTGVSPSVVTATVATDALGAVEFRLNGKATAPKLNSLDVIGRFEDGNLLTGSTYIDFEPTNKGILSTQAEQIVGEPTTIEEYLDALPIATNESELEKIQTDAPSAVVLDHVVHYTVDGKVLPPLDAVMLNSPAQVIDTQLSAGQEHTLQAAACPPKKTTSITLKMSVSGSVVNIPTGLNIAILDDRGVYTIVRSQDGGVVSWPFSCSSFLRFEVQAQPANRIVDGGIKMTTGSGGIVVWAKRLDAATGNLTADNIRGKNVNITAGASAFGQKSQRVFFRARQVWGWERTIPKRGSRFSYVVEIYYPYGGSGGLSNIGVISYPDSFTFYDPGIFHEYGHQAYYLRVLGLSQFNQLRNKTPLCFGSLTWTLWTEGEGCVGMLEGWAVFFENVATDKFNTASGRPIETNRYDPKPSDGPTSIGTPGNVAGYLWDITDDHGSNPDLNDFDNDLVVYTNQSIEKRFERTGNFFYNQPENANFKTIWDANFKPALRATGTCKTQEFPTLLKNKMLLGCP